MSKAILLVDMPMNCGECCFLRGLNTCYLKRSIERDGIITIYTVDKQIMDMSKPSWCPLKPMPEKIGMEEALKMPRNGCIGDVINSYNACIDELLK